MDSKTLAKVFLVAGFLCVLAAFAWAAWMVFGMGVGLSIESPLFLIVSVLLGAGIVLIVLAKKTYR